MGRPGAPRDDRLGLWNRWRFHDANRDRAAVRHIQGLGNDLGWVVSPVRPKLIFPRPAPNERKDAWPGIGAHLGVGEGPRLLLASNGRAALTGLGWPVF